MSWAEEQINARDPVYKVASGMVLPGQNEPVEVLTTRIGFK